MLRTSSTLRALATVAVVLLAMDAATSGNGRKFYDDDPLAYEPETVDASGVKKWDIDLFFDLAENLFARPGDPTPDQKARNINTIDEVPDSSWFTNRVLARPLSIDEAVRGPLAGSGPAAGTWAVVEPKQAGASAGFTMRDRAGDLWFVSFDAKGFPEAATGAILVANKIFWTLGYWQVENYLVSVRPDQLTIAESARTSTGAGKQRPMRSGDIEAVLRRAHRSTDGTYRAVAARAVPGRPLGGFRYYGTRPDDPNDIVPHEHRRELRALKVFGAWTNLTDMKAGNTLDALVTEGGRATVRHYLQDVGSSFGTGANGPHDWDEGSEFLFESSRTLRRLYTFGFDLEPWHTTRYVNNVAIGRFEGTRFDPLTWKPHAATAAFLRARADDTFWAARRVMAFSDEMIRAIVKTGRYSDPQAEELLGTVLIQRRDKIGRAYLPALNPVVNVALDAGGNLTFENAAVSAGVAAPPPGGYAIEWSRFDNATGQVGPAIGSTTAGADGRSAAPGGLPSDPGAFIVVQIRAVQTVSATWSTPVHAYFRRTDGWKLVGFERLP